MSGKEWIWKECGDHEYDQAHYIELAIYIYILEIRSHYVAFAVLELAM